MQGNYFDSKDFKNLLRRYEDAAKVGKPIYLDSDQLTDIAEYYHWKGKSSEAIAVADYALSMFEGATGPLVLKARIALLNENMPEKAEMLAEQIADKNDLEYYYIKAEILVATARGEDADLYLESCLDQIDEFEICDFILDAAILFVDYEHTTLGRKWLERSEETDLADYRETLGRILFYEKDYEGCERIFEQLIDESPYTSFYWDMLASTQLAQDNLSDAITSSEYAIAINPNDDDALLYKGQALMRLKNYEGAIKFFLRQSEVRETNIDGYVNAAYCMFSLDKYEEGLNYLDKAKVRAKRYCPDRLWEIYQEETFAYSHNHELSKALDCLAKMEESPLCDPNELQVFRGHVYCENDQTEEARNCYKSAIANSNYDPHIMLRVGVSLYDNDFVEIAYKVLSSLDATDLDKIPQAHAYLSICAHDLNMRDAFLQHLKEAIEKSPIATRALLGTMFPEGMSPNEYYNYAIKQPIS